MVRVSDNRARHFPNQQLGLLHWTGVTKAPDVTYPKMNSGQYSFFTYDH